VLYGPAILKTIGVAFHQHLDYILGAIGVLVGLLVFYTVRKLFAKRRGTQFPAEDGSAE
jgi:hypothetical protein